MQRTCTSDVDDTHFHGSAQLAQPTLGASLEPEATLGCVGVVLHVVEDAGETTARISTCEAPKQQASVRSEAKNDVQGNDSDVMDDGDDDDEEWRAHIDAQLLSAKPIILRYGETALHLAAERGLEETVCQLLAVCPSLIDEAADSGATALHVATSEGHAGVVAQLLAVKPDLVDAQRVEEGLNIFLMAAYRGHASIVTQLLAVNPALIDGPNGWEAVYQAAHGGHPEVVSQLLAFSPDLLKEATSKGWTELHFAAHAGNAEVVTQLLSADPTSIDAKTDEDWTALHWAAYGGHVAIVKQLLAADPGLIEAKTYGDWTALHCAAFMGHEETTRYLAMMNSALDARAIGGETALHYAVRKGHEGVVAFLLAAYPDSINALDGYDDSTLLHIAANEGHKGVAAQLLAVKPALIHATTKREGWTALHCAIRHGCAGVVAQLLSLHPASVHAVSTQGWTVLHCAAYSGSRKIFSRLLASVPQDARKQMLFQQSTDSHLSAKRGSTVLHVAVKYDKSEVVALLLDVSPTLVDELNDEKQTCLHLLYRARRESDVAIGEMLLASKPDLVHAVDANGNTILHSMTYQDFFESRRTPRELIKRAWKLNPDALRAVNQDGKTPFDIAVTTDNHDAIDLLQWSLTFDEVMSAYDANCCETRKKGYVQRFKPLMKLQCEELVVVLIPDVVRIVFEYLGL